MNKKGRGALHYTGIELIKLKSYEVFVVSGSLRVSLSQTIYLPRNLHFLSYYYLDSRLLPKLFVIVLQRALTVGTCWYLLFFFLLFVVFSSYILRVMLGLLCSQKEILYLYTSGKFTTIKCFMISLKNFIHSANFALSESLHKCKICLNCRTPITNLKTTGMNAVTII